MKWIDGNGALVPVVIGDWGGGLTFLDDNDYMWTYRRDEVPPVIQTHPLNTTGAGGSPVYFTSTDCTGTAFTRDDLTPGATFRLLSPDPNIYVRPIAVVAQAISAASVTQNIFGACYQISPPVQRSLVPVASLVKVTPPVVVPPVHPVRAL